MDRELPVSVWPEWKIIEKIGEGSFGKVYKAKRMERDKAFYSAIKIISIPSNRSELKSVRAEMDSDQAAREYFQNLVDECIQEVSTMEYFRGNSHVVAVEDYKVVEYLDDIGWDIYIRMEYLTSFLEYCAGKQISEEEVIQLGIDLCKALEYCQKLNIIHRDMKPENIFVSRFGEFKLGDFGIARELERNVSTLSKKGTFSYMAPEMYKGEKYDSRVDIYSLGIMLYKLRNRNRLPFINLEKQLITYRDKENALNRRMSGEKLPAPADAGDKLSRVILKACSYRPEDRYESAEEFRAELESMKYQKKEEEKAVARKKAQQEKMRQEKIRQQELARREEEKRQEAARQQELAHREEEKRQEAARQQKASAEEKESERAYTPEELRRKGNVSRDIQQSDVKKYKKKQKKNGVALLTTAVVVMSIAVILIGVIFFRMLLRDPSTTQQPSEVTELLGGEGADESEKEGLAKDLSVIRERISTIVSELDTYNWIGTESDGKISYLDTYGNLRKIEVFPKLSDDGVYEEYYYWEKQLFFAYIWEDDTVNDSLDSGEVRANRFYYKDGTLIRWIDDRNMCHDYETDNDEYNALGEKYLKRSVNYTEEFQ